jgi:D-alanyl-D-alanine endopeptidase (penicillin-binding protein 7)
MHNLLKVLAALGLLTWALQAAVAVGADAPLVGAVDRPAQPPSMPSLAAPVPGLSMAPISAQTFAPKIAAGELARRPNVQLRSRSVLVVRADNGEVLYRKNIDQDLPIASITKLMTAMIVLDAAQPLHETLSISQEDVDTLKNTHSRLRVGTQLTRGELMLLALMSSENRAASALARNYPGGRNAAIAAMNRKAGEIGMTHAHFVDGTGLSSANRASPVDLVRMVKAADSYDSIRQYSTTVQHAVRVGKQTQLFRNTNSLVRSPEWSIDLTKTGFINEAGRCLVMQARIADMPVIMVLMNSQGTKTRVGDANRVRQWLESTLRLSASGVRAGSSPRT